MSKLLSVLLVVRGDSAARVQLRDSAGSEGVSKAPADRGPSPTQIASLAGVDIGAKATGSSVGDLITVEDVKEIIGRDDIVFANES